MTDEDRTRQIHELDATLRVGKSGVESVADELNSQLQDRDLVKVKFLRSALGGTTIDEAAADLADLASAEVVETRGHTAVFER
ncbi:YhbY family RNA-binding protein [Halomicrobium salinisoli]|uniref:YhbY family RNA-binding protein n=1 Tax=Halomicrobium salinisoli TaxID=2878391 RepID=UPI001CF05EDB|nr:YhbY family RNA-binding protein [Halomicrobium salinisoli]